MLRAKCKLNAELPKGASPGTFREKLEDSEALDFKRKASCIPKNYRRAPAYRKTLVNRTKGIPDAS